MQYHATKIGGFNHSFLGRIMLGRMKVDNVGDIGKVCLGK
jgi:hypothetical protein